MKKTGASAGLLFAFALGVLFATVIKNQSIIASANETATDEIENSEGMYSIIFHEDFGDGEDHVFVQEIMFGESATLIKNPWSHDGYDFAGWYSSDYGINHALANAYADEAEVKDLSKVNGDVIDLYAGWIAKAG